jgi:hypothetical protein
VTAFAIEVDRERTIAWLIGAGWLDPEEADDLDAIEGALSDAINAWIAEPAKMPEKERR